MPKQLKPSETQIRRALDIAGLIQAAHIDGIEIPTVAGVDAINLADVLLYFEPLAKRPAVSGPPIPMVHSPRIPAAGEVLAPERRATPWKKPIEGIDR